MSCPQSNRKADRFRSAPSQGKIKPVVASRDVPGEMSSAFGRGNVEAKIVRFPPADLEKADRFRSAPRKAKNHSGCSSEGSAKGNSMHVSFRFPWNREPWNLQLQTQKADRFRSAPYSQKTPILAAFWGYVRSSEVIDSAVGQSFGEAQAHMLETFRGTRTLRYLWYEQRGLCTQCYTKITRITGWCLHYCAPRVKGGSTGATNCVLLHPECHDRVHRQRLPVSKPRLL
jgi:hypothetical protein